MRVSEFRVGSEPCGFRERAVIEKEKWGGQPLPSPRRLRKLTADVNHSGDALVSSDFAEQSESGPEGAVVLSRDADDDGRCSRRKVLDWGAMFQADASALTRFENC